MDQQQKYLQDEDLPPSRPLCLFCSIGLLCMVGFPRLQAGVPGAI